MDQQQYADVVKGNVNMKTDFTSMVGSCTPQPFVHPQQQSPRVHLGGSGDLVDLPHHQGTVEIMDLAHSPPAPDVLINHNTC